MRRYPSNKYKVYPAVLFLLEKELSSWELMETCLKKYIKLLFFDKHFIRRIIESRMYNPPAQKEVSTWVLTHRDDRRVLLKKEIKNGLYPFKSLEYFSSDRDQVIYTKNCPACQRSALGAHISYATMGVADWHKNLGHIIEERLFKASRIFDCIPNFTSSTIKKLFCTDCPVAKYKHAPV